jgi:putative ABC transport system substrate-binding protein
MRRREFIALVGGTAVSWSPAALAQQRQRRVGVMMSVADDDEGQRRLRAFRAGLEHAGWSENRNVRLDVRWSMIDADRAMAAAKELIGAGPDAILTSGTAATAAMRQATDTLPVVFTVVSEPVEQGFVRSLARPGGNMSGFTNFEPSLGAKWVELLKTIAPQVKRAALIFNPQTAPFAALISRSAEAAAVTLGVELVRTPVRDPAEIDAAIEGLQSHAGDGLIVPPDTFLNLHRKRIIDLASRRQLPAIYPFRYIVAEGGLLSYGIDLADQFRQAAEYIDRILRGANPADLPVQQPTKFELVINRKTADALGLAIAPSLLTSADEVIE